ncbi:hypothetical protein AA14337_2911 [Acetobacter malorum DSM 14337]|uniref:Phage protein n=1 Tax=Acetobacter malorum DSM 14337 TaxID=1307910 RepID=A0ABQ0PYK4_9PROT|nr:hypothetical protein [Acetobacter malorum]KXV06784.1 hypothetical protein AD930_06710 [Acetobacter malorum]GBQ84778.1 hypothetical protein AA14337_2911 [Acetobacter malorum DSM 14337]
MNLGYCLDIATSHATFQNDFDATGDSSLDERQRMQAFAIENVESWFADNGDAIRRIQEDFSLPTPLQVDMEPGKEFDPGSLEWCLKTTLSLADGDISPMTEDKDGLMALTGLRNIIANKMPELLALPFSPKMPEPTHDPEAPSV